MCLRYAQTIQGSDTVTNRHVFRENSRPHKGWFASGGVEHPILHPKPCPRKGTSIPGRARCFASTSSISSTSSSSSGISGGSRLGVAVVRPRWLPDQPTFVCPPDFPKEPPLPSDEQWADQGTYICYGKADLSFEEVDRLLQLCNLDMEPSDLRTATEVVWAYRYRGVPWEPPVAVSGNCGNPQADSDGLPYTLVGFASADVATPTALLKAAAGGSIAGRPGPSTPRRQSWHTSPRAGSGPRARPSKQRAITCTAPNVMAPTTADGGGGSITQVERSRMMLPPYRPKPGPVESCTDGALSTIWFLAVHPSQRGAGLGRALLERLVSSVREHDVGSITLRATSRAAPFYDRLGWPRDPGARLVKAGRALALP